MGARATRWRGAFWLWLALSLVATVPLVAAPTDDHPGFWRLSPRDGLPPAVVYCIAQDPQGFLWFGTAGGAARFDGHEFRVFLPDPNDPESISNAAILAIDKAPDGDLWVATEGGLDRWRRDTERFSHYRHDPADPTSLSDDTTQALESEPDGTLWVGTARGGLNRLDPKTGKFEHVALPTERADGTAIPWIRCLLRDEQGILWIGTSEDGLYAFDPKTKRFQRYLHRDDDAHSLTDDWVAAVAADQAGNLWVGTQKGLCCLSRERRAFERHEIRAPGDGELPTRSVTAVIVDHTGMIWLGTDGAGFCRYDPVLRRVTRSRHSSFATNTLAADAVRAVFEDASGDIWVGHFPEGVSHFDRLASAFQVFYSVPGETNSLSDGHVLCFLEEPDGDLWVGTDNGGANHWDAATNRWSAYRYSPGDPNSLGGKAALSVFRDSRGELWIGTWDGGLNRLSPQSDRFIHYLPDPRQPGAISSVHVWQMVEDRQHRMWIATIGGGVERYVPEQDTFVHHRYDPQNPRSLNDDIASALMVARDGALWVGTPKGLARWNETTSDWDRFSSGSAERGQPGNYWIFDLAEDRDGSIWFTTEGGGLRHLDPKTGRLDYFRTANGLPSDILRGLIVGDDGVLWIGSNRGLIRFDPATGQIRVFDESNGLPGTLFAPHARLRLTNGDLLFGTTRGFIRFNPSAVEADNHPPPVVLTSFEIFNQRIEPGRPESPLVRSITDTKRLVIPSRYSVVSFQFAALCYRSTGQTQYRFKLEGFDRDWRTPGPERRATFTNLDPGEYQLRVRAANSDGAWNDHGVALDLVIVPPWWATRWFKAAMLLLLVGGAAMIGWWISSHRERETRRQRELLIERERTREREQAAAELQVLNQELENRVADRTARLSNAVRELEAFSYSVSHDLRAPLRTVDGFSRALLTDYESKLDEEGKENLRTIRTATKRMGQLIDDLLNLARVTQNELRCGQIDLSTIAKTVADSLRQANPQRTIFFVIEPNLTVFADARLLQIVLENLFGNACKFTSTRAEARIEFGQTLREGKPFFFVRDNGVGFNPAYAQKLFKAFKRLHTEAEFPGTGIGLATVDRIIRRHGGTVAAESELERGATFYFSIDVPKTTA